MIQDKFIPLKESIILKELGFDEPCVARFIKTQFSMNVLGNWYKHNSNEVSTKFLGAILWQDVFDWFREKHNLPSMVYPVVYAKNLIEIEQEDMVYSYQIYQNGKTRVFTDEEDTYEIARLKCLQKLIEIIKE